MGLENESEFARRSLPITNQKLWEMAKLITDRQKKAKESISENIDWNDLEESWFDWLECQLFDTSE